MGLITRCPACQTSFRVVPDQLRMSEGWARCGHCSEIFDAASSLQDDTPLASSSVPVDVNLNSDEAEQAVADPVAKPELRPQTPSAPLSATMRDDIALTAALQEIVAARSGAVDESEARRSSGYEGVGPTGRSEGDISSLQKEVGKEPSVSFLQKIHGRSAWRKPWVRASLALAGIALLGLLVGQVVIHQRDRLAALFPQSKPALEAACGYLNCRVSTLRQIDAIVVESSTFSKIRNDTYRLSLAIKNTAPYELAMPAMELTLTDPQDQALVRRVLLGPEVNPNNKLGADSEWIGSVDLSVRSGGAADRIAGYRILVFYP